MNVVRCFCGLQIVLAFSAAVIWAGKQPPAGPEDHVWLHLDGKYIRKPPTCSDPDGIWQGCGWSSGSGFSYRPIPGFFDEYLPSVPGMNWCRLAWTQQGHSKAMGQSWGYPVDFTTKMIIDTFVFPWVAACKRAKQYVLIDYHWSSPNFYNYTRPRAQSDSLVDEWIKAWEYIATLFKDDPWILGYELVNEPSLNNRTTNPDDSTLWCTVSYREVREMFKRCTRAIRAIDTSHIIVTGGVHHGSLEGIKELWEYDGGNDHNGYALEDVELPENEKYDFGDDYNQTAVRTHRYVNPVYKEGGITAENVEPASQYGDESHRPFPWLPNANEYLAYFRARDICLFWDEMGHYTSIFAKYTVLKDVWSNDCQPFWNFARYSAQQIIEICTGTKNFWKDGPKTNKYSGAVNQGEGTVLGADKMAAYGGLDMWGVGAQYYQAPAEAYPSEGEPAGTNYPWTWFGFYYATTYPNVSANCKPFEDIWKFACEKSGSRPAERCANPPCESSVAALSDGEITVPERPGLRGNMLYLGSTHVSGRRNVQIVGADGRTIFSAVTDAAAVPMHSLPAGVYLVSVANGRLMINSSIVIP